MNTLISAFNFVVSLLVSVGDGVIFLGTLPLKILGRAGRRVQSARYVKKSFGKPRTSGPLEGEFVISSAQKSKKNNNIPLGNIVGSVIRIGGGVAIWYWARRMQILEKKEAEKRRQARREPRLRPSIFYKLKYIFAGFILSAIFIFIPLASFIFVSDLPNLSDLSVASVSKTTKIFDRNGSLLYEIFVNQNRTVVRLSDVPKTLRDATVAIEDKDFYSHPGFDLRGMARAFVTNIRKRGFQGGSTITQQLVKSAFLSSETTIERKIKEIALAFWAERRYSKNQILELYFNYVPYGGTAWGIESAADIYFGRRVQDLDLAESAFLAGLPQSPSVYSPLFNEGNAWKTRQKEVLKAMLSQRYITNAQFNEAIKEKLTFKSQRVPLLAPHFVMYVRDLLVHKFGINEVERGGLNVTTTLDLSTQERAEQIVSDEIDQDTALNIGNGAALITTPINGDILAMVGSRNYFDPDRDGNVNLTTSLRQPGSSIKLITYTLALSQGYTEATILDDTPLTIAGIDGSPSYTPVNYDGAFHGRIPLRTAFANSFNIPPVRLTQKFGPEAVKNFGQKMGISSWDGLKNYGVSITLGAADVKMTDMATAYGVMANGGKRVDLDPLLEVKDSYGTVVYKKHPNLIDVVDAGVAFIISDILSDNRARSIEFGLNTPLNIPGAHVSVKTGTTDNKRDNWTIGYTPNVLVATWVGNNDNTPMNQALASGITGAAPMWNKLMTMMLGKVGTPSAVVVPDNVIKKYCLGQDRYFIKGTEKSVSCGSLPQTTLSPTPVR